MICEICKQEHYPIDSYSWWSKEFFDDDKPHRICRDCLEHNVKIYNQIDEFNKNSKSQHTFFKKGKTK